MDVGAYLARIGYSGPPTPTLETLQGLHEAHYRTVPFENLDIALGRPIRLEETALFEKIVVRRRGGFCYELNGLFAALLRALGFRVTLLSAGVMSSRRREFGPEFDHLSLRVALAEPWLADVGFGEAFCRPLLLDVRDEQQDPCGVFRIVAGRSLAGAGIAGCDGNVAAGLSLHADAARTGRFRGNVPLSADLARLGFHPAQHLLAADRDWPGHGERAAADRDQ